MIKPYTAIVGLRYTGLRKRSRLMSFISMISILGLAFGVALLLVVLSVMNGFDKEMRDRILGLVPQVTVYHYQSIDDWQAVAELAMDHPLVEAAAPFVQLQGMWMNRGVVEGGSLYAVEAEFESKVSIIESYLSEGSLQQLDQQQDAVVMSQRLATKLKAKVGDKLTLIVPAAGKTGRVSPRLKRFQLTGLFETETEFDNALALINLSVGSELLGLDGKVQGVRLKVSDLFLAPDIAMGVLQNLPPSFYARHWGQTHGNLYQAIQLSRRMVSLLLFIIIAVAVFNVVSTLVLAVKEKQADIAILRSMGASPAEIRTIFMIQGLMIGVVGTVGGLLFGLLLAYFSGDLVILIEQLLDMKFLNTDVYPISYLPVDIRLADLILIGGASLGMSLIATIYPAMRAAKVMPAEALRYE